MISQEERKFLELLCDSPGQRLEYNNIMGKVAMLVGDPTTIPGYRWRGCDKIIIQKLVKKGILSTTLHTYSSEHLGSVVNYTLCLSTLKKFPELNELRIQIALGLTHNKEVL